MTDAAKHYADKRKERGEVPTMTDASQRGEVVVVPRSFVHGGHRVIDIAYTAFMMARQPNDEDGGPTDWMNDTLPVIDRLIAAAPPAPSGDSGAWEALSEAADSFARIKQHVGERNIDFASAFARADHAETRARQALALRYAGGGSLRPSACVPSGDVDGGAA